MFALLAELKLFVEDGLMPRSSNSGAPNNTAGVIRDAVVSRGTGVGGPVEEAQYVVLSRAGSPR
jgi:hypothetical protein